MNIGTPRQPPFIKTCPTCGHVFKVFVSSQRRGGGKYCSRACYPRTGSSNGRWKGGRITGPDGRTMVYTPGHPGAKLVGGKYIYEYRLVAEQSIGRILDDGEIVHHINGDHTDNRPENLAVMTQSEHMKLHLPEMNKAASKKRVSRG